MTHPTHEPPDDGTASGLMPVDVARLTPLTPTGEPRHEKAVITAGFRMWLHLRAIHPDEVAPGVRLAAPAPSFRPSGLEAEVRFTLGYHDPENASRPLRAVDDPAVKAATALQRLAPQVALEVWAPAPGLDAWTYAVMPLLGPHPARRSVVVSERGAEVYYRLRTGSSWGRGCWPVAADGDGQPALLPEPVTASSLYVIVTTPTPPPAIELAHTEET